MNRKKVFSLLRRTLSVALAVLMLLSAAPLSGFVGLEFPEWHLPQINWQTLSPFASAEQNTFTEGYYTYTVTDGEATITAVDSTISGDVVIPGVLGEYPVTKIGNDVFYRSIIFFVGFDVSDIGLS